MCHRFSESIKMKQNIHGISLLAGKLVEFLELSLLSALGESKKNDKVKSLPLVSYQSRLIKITVN